MNTLYLIASRSLFTLIIASCITACGSGRSTSGGSFSDIVGTYTGSTTVKLARGDSPNEAQSFRIVISITIETTGRATFTSNGKTFATVRIQNNLDIVAASASASAIFGRADCSGSLTLFVNRSNAPNFLKGYWQMGTSACGNLKVDSIAPFDLVPD